MTTLATAFLGLLAQKDAHDVSIAILFHYAKRTLPINFTIIEFPMD